MGEQIVSYLNTIATHNVWVQQGSIFVAETLGILLLVGLVVFLFSHEHKGQGFYNIIVILASAIGAYSVAFILKHTYLSPRPFVELSNITPLVKTADLYGSFPSGHATFFMALAIVLFFYHKRIATFYFVCAILIGVARIVVGVHWPIDIVSGWVIGGVLSWGIYKTYLRFFEKRKK